MRSYLKFVENVTTNINFFVKTIVWLIKQIKNESFTNHIQSKSKRDSVLILANGPSLLDILSYVLQIRSAHDICVVNDFCKSDYFQILEPDIYVLADPMYFDSKIRRPTETETIQRLLEMTTWPMDIHIPYSALKLTEQTFVSNSFLKIVPYHSNSYSGWECLKFFLYKKGLSMPRIQNVLIPSIFNSMNMNYRIIRLLGADHSWSSNLIIDDNNQVCLRDNHFYDNEKELQPWLKVNGEPYKMHEILRDLANMFDGYHELKQYAERKKCVIINCTPNSFIDAFVRSQL